MANKVKQLYDIGSIVAAGDVAKNFRTRDGKTFDAAGILLPRQLEHISSTIYQQRFAELTLLTSAGITVNNEGGVVENITKIKQSINGDFATAGNSTNTDGKISLSAESDTIPVVMKKAESSWSEVELMQAQQANRNLPSDLIGAHNTRYNQQIDMRGYVGDGNFKGLLNWTGFPTTAAGGVFSGLTAQQMYDEVKDLVNVQRALVSNDPVFGANKLSMSGGIFNLLTSTILNTANGALSVMEAIKANLNIDPVITFRAKDLGVIVAYASNDRAMVMRIPMQLRISNIYQKGFDSYVESMFRVGGLDVIENQSGYILTGVE